MAKRAYRHYRAKRDKKIAMYIVGGLAVAALGYGAYYYYQKQQTAAAPQLPPTGGTTPTPTAGG